jgi:tetratricopeptide (TPR) repeat protein
MALVLERGVLCIVLPFLGCASGPRGPGPSSAEGSRRYHAGDEGPTTWADGLDALVFGDGGDEGEAAPGPGGSPAAPDSGRADLERTAARAVEAVQEDRLEDAAPLLERAAAAAPAAERWRYERALADTLLALGRSADAARLYEGLLVRGGPGAGAETLGNLAAAYYRLGDGPRAREASAGALEARPGSPEALKTLGLAEILEGEEEGGAARLRQALAADPAIPEALLALAEIEEDAGEGRSALERYRKLLDLAAAAEGGGRDPGRRLRGLFLFRPAAARRSDALPAPARTSMEVKARIQRLEGGGTRAP